MQNTWSQDLYIKAYRFAAVAHNGQLLPGSELPYILHIGLVAMEVIGTLAREPGLDGDLAISCALLHDTLEDTDTTYSQLSETFGSRVADGVAALSKDPDRRGHRGKMAQGRTPDGGLFRADQKTAPRDLGGEDGRPHNQPATATVPLDP